MQFVKRWCAVGLAGALLMPGAVHAGQPAELPFDDIANHWAQQAIVRVAEAGLMTGRGDGKQFAPEKAMTRGEFVVLMDRLMHFAEQDLFALTLLSEHGVLEGGEVFDEPYLPYRDVDRLTWLYPSALRLSVALERMFGPGAIQQVFPGDRFFPDEPITREEAARLLSVLAPVFAADSPQQWAREQGFLTGSLSGPLKRGEAAAMIDRVRQYLDLHPLLPLLDLDGTRFPAVPEISELFPLFGDYGDVPGYAERTYLEAVEAISTGTDEEATYQALKNLARSGFPNQVGVHYYLSWNFDTPLEENLDEAFRALDAYFAERRMEPEVLRLLAANIYDLSLQLEGERSDIYSRTLKRLLPYEERLERGSEEWQSLGIYLAALEVKSGRVEQAIARYRSLTATREGLLNALHFLLKQGRRADADALMAEARALEDAEWSESFLDALEQEFSLLDRQEEFRRVLEQALDRLESAAGYRAEGEAVLGGYAFKYRVDMDNASGLSHTTGYYKSPGKLVLEPLDVYTDERQNVTYLRQFDENRWEVQTGEGDDYVHEWVERLSPGERAKELGARYHLQSLGSFDVVTEWIPAEALTARAKTLSVQAGRLEMALSFVNKYYVDRESGKLVRRMWLYEELYDSGEFLLYAGTESYADYGPIRVDIPEEARKGVQP